MNLSSYILILLLLVGIGIAQIDKDDPRKGWFFYKEEVKEKEEKEKSEDKSRGQATKKKDFEFPVRPEAPEPVKEFLKNPNEQTAEAYLRWQYRYFKHLEKVGYALQQAYLKKGREIYPIKGYPQTPLLSVEYQAQKREIYSRVLSSLRDKVGLIYFFSARCQVCEMQDPIIEKLYYNYGLPVRAVSVDGTVKDYPFPVVVNPELAVQMGVRATPTIVMVIESEQGPVVNFVGVGFTPFDLLESRIITSLVVNGVITGQELNANWELLEDVER